jgi:membrane protein
MWKQIKIGLAGILQSLGYFLVLFLLLSMFDSKDIIKIYSVESIYLIFDSLQWCVARGKFYSKDRDTKGMTVLYFVSIVVVVAGIFTRSLGVASLGVICFILNYIYYAEELALYEQKDVLLPNIVYIAIRFMIAFVIFKFELLSEFELWHRFFFARALSEVVGNFSFKRLIWNYSLLSFVNFNKDFSLLLKEEFNGIKESLIRDNNTLVTKVFKSVVTIGLSSIKGAESIVSFILTIQKLGIPLFTARDFNYKVKRNRIVDTDGETMQVPEDKFIFRVSCLWLLLVILTPIVSWYFNRVPVYIVFILMVTQFLHYSVFMNNLFFRETFLKNRGRGFSVTRIYILKHGLRALLLVLTQSFLVYLFSMWFEVLLHYAFTTYLYKKECNKYNLKYKMFKLSSLWDSNV